MAQVAIPKPERSTTQRIIGRRSWYGWPLGRELAFAAHHGVHHNAMINAICAELGVATPHGFGKAPSTINHECDKG